MDASAIDAKRAAIRQLEAELDQALAGHEEEDRTLAWRLFRAHPCFVLYVTSIVLGPIASVVTLVAFILSMGQGGPVEVLVLTALGWTLIVPGFFALLATTAHWRARTDLNQHLPCWKCA
jgi:hypothetical protein